MLKFYMEISDGPLGTEPPQKMFCDFSNGNLPVINSVDPGDIVEVPGGLLPGQCKSKIGFS
jgi:hypothetical protein